MTINRLPHTCIKGPNGVPHGHCLACEQERAYEELTTPPVAVCACGHHPQFHWEWKGPATSYCLYIGCNCQEFRPVAFTVERTKQHARTCPAYGNYQPPYEECNCGREAKP
jgi:hypothetical protein